MNITTENDESKDETTVTTAPSSTTVTVPTHAINLPQPFHQGHIYARVAFMANHKYLVDFKSWKQLSIAQAINWLFETNYTFKNDEEAIIFTYATMHHMKLKWASQSPESITTDDKDILITQFISSLRLLMVLAYQETLTNNAFIGASTDLHYIAAPEFEPNFKTKTKFENMKFNTITLQSDTTGSYLHIPTPAHPTGLIVTYDFSKINKNRSIHEPCMGQFYLRTINAINEAQTNTKSIFYNDKIIQKYIETIFKPPQPHSTATQSQITTTLATFDKYLKSQIKLPTTPTSQATNKAIASNTVNIFYNSLKTTYGHTQQKNDNFGNWYSDIINWIESGKNQSYWNELLALKTLINTLYSYAKDTFEATEGTHQWTNTQQFINWATQTFAHNALPDQLHRELWHKQIKDSEKVTNIIPKFEKDNKILNIAIQASKLTDNMKNHYQFNQTDKERWLRTTFQTYRNGRIIS